MLKKAHVVNIGFAQNIKNRKMRKSVQSRDDSIQAVQINLQSYLNSHQCMQNTCQLLKIFKNRPIHIKQIQQNILSRSISAANDKKIYYSQLQTQQMGQILPTIKKVTQYQQPVDSSNSRKASIKSINIQMTKAQSVNVTNKSSCDQIKELSNFYFINQNNLQRQILSVKQKNVKTHFNSIQNLFNYQEFYLIPLKYRNSLLLLLNQFLNFKLLMNGTSESFSKTANIFKKPKTTIKMTHSTFKLKQNILPKNKDTLIKPLTANQKKSHTDHTFFNSTSSKPFTAKCQNRVQHKIEQPILQSIKTGLLGSCTYYSQDFNQNLQKYLQIQKQLQRKNRKIITLQNEIDFCYKELRQRNNQIKQLKTKQNTLKKKCKYEVDRIIKSKALSEINEIYLTNTQQQISNGKGVFQINGKKYIRSEEVNVFSQSPFLTSPKSALFQKDFQLFNKSKVQIFLMQEAQFVKKNKSIFNFSKGSNNKVKIQRNNKLDEIKLRKWLQNLRKDVLKFQKQKQQILDKLAENNEKLQKHIQKIQTAISLRNFQIQRCLQQIHTIQKTQC